MFVQYGIQFTLGFAEIGQLLIGALTRLGQRIDCGIQLRLAGIGHMIADPQAVRQQVAQGVVNGAAGVGVARSGQLRYNVHRAVCLMQTRTAFTDIGFEFVGAFQQRAQCAFAVMPAPLTPAGVKRQQHGADGYGEADPE